jgi:hypothetical protein
MNTRLASTTHRIAITSATLLAAAATGVTGLASAASSPGGENTTVQCPSACVAIYKPVTCLMSNGHIRTFTNRCVADVYACEHRLIVLACWPPDGE